MKKRQKNGLWYNACGKEIGGILLEGREAALRRGGPWPDARAGLRWAQLCADIRANTL